MLRSTNKKVLEKIHDYIINGVDHEYFNLEADPDFKTACKLILTACQNEKRYCRYNNDFEMFKDWAQGLPTAFNTCYYYNVSAVDMLGAWVHHPLRRIRDVLLLIGCASLIWEGVTPAINPKSVFDWLDFLCYFAGAVAYWLLIHKSKSNKKSTF